MDDEADFTDGALDGPDGRCTGRRGMGVVDAISASG